MKIYTHCIDKEIYKDNKKIKDTLLYLNFFIAFNIILFISNISGYLIVLTETSNS